MYTEIDPHSINIDAFDWLFKYFESRIEILNPQEDLLEVRGILDHNLPYEIIRIEDITDEEKLLINLVCGRVS